MAKSLIDSINRCYSSLVSNNLNTYAILLEELLCISKSHNATLVKVLTSGEFIAEHTIGSVDLKNISSSWMSITLPKSKNIIIYDCDHISEDVNLFLPTLDNIVFFIQQQDRVIEDQKKNEIDQQVSKLKDNFLANMSHEIRTPLNGIIGMTSMLEVSDLSLSQQKYVSIIHSCSTHLLSIINDILDYSKMVAGKFKLTENEFNIRKCIESSYETVILKAEEKCLEVHIEIDSNIPHIIIGDEKRIRQILVNLISNAIKFTFKGYVKIKASLCNLSDSICVLQFKVEDSGIGIAEQNLNNIFNMFEQVDNKITAEGTGLGLAISKSLVGLMNGNVVVESKVGVGSVFTFTIKVKYKNEFVIDDHLTGKHALIVDDDINDRVIYFDLLTRWKMNVQMCSTIIEASLLLKNNKFDVMLLDICMSDINEFARVVHTDYPKIHIIAMVNELSIAYDIFTSKLTKPLKEIELYNALNDIYRCFVNQTTPLNLNVLVAEDNTSNQVVICELLKELGITRIKLVNNGQDVVKAVTLDSNYDLILLDVKMPILDGYETMIELNKLCVKLPKVIAITANALEGEMEKCLKAGMNSYLAKPIVINQLYTEIQRVMLI